MSKRKDFSKEGRKSDPFTIRFPKTFLEEIKKIRGLEKGQPIADFLVDMYNQTFHPIVANPIMERNSRAEKPNDNVPGKIGKDLPTEKKRGLSDKFANAKKDVLIQQGDLVDDTGAPSVGQKKTLVPPKDLKGIDLTIWKRENGIK